MGVALTKEKEFLTESGDKVKVPTMHLQGKIELAVLEQLKSKVLRLPYKGDRIVMDIVLPDDKGGLKVLEQKLKTLDEKDLLNENIFQKEVIVDLPKFKLEKTWNNLKDVLKKLGMTEIFRGGFQGIAKGPLMVSDVIQKVFRGGRDGFRSCGCHRNGYEVQVSADGREGNPFQSGPSLPLLSKRHANWATSLPGQSE